MSRALTVIVLALAAFGLSAQDRGSVEPLWTLRAAGPVTPGVPFTVTAEVRLPRGYYQDVASPFLSLEPAPPIAVLERGASAPTFRQGKESFTGTFTLTRTVTLPVGTAEGESTLNWKAGWQICQVDGVCLLPAERTLTLKLDVRAVASPSPPAASTAGLGFWGALLGALLGGLLLNLMPCVFPVLALKAVGLVSSAGATRRERAREAWAFAAGGFGSVTALGVVTAAFAALGQRLDWGFSFQQPAFVWILTLLFWVFALQLWGIWGWAGSPFTLTSARRGWPRALAGGALLVLAAAPCTAPLLGPALGFAFAQPPVFIPFFFAAAGAGLVLPLLAIQAFPGWAKLLPKPGRWMVTAERVAGFFLAATVLYLLWVFTRQTAPDRVWPALGALGALAGALAWAGRYPQSKFVRTVALVAVLGAGAAAWPLSAPAAATPAVKADGWGVFSRAAVDRALAEGRPVLVDATAAWCTTCQVNELAVLGRADVTALLDRLGIVRLRADYTRPDPVIRQWLEDVHRAGLPVYALYRPGRPVYLFPELLTDGNFTAALPTLVAAP